MATTLLLRGGTVIDGTGRPGYLADVAIVDRRIAEIGPDLGAAYADATVIDAGDQVVAPGFIDIHTHYDAQVFWDPALTPSCFHGVTTVVAGNCGFSVAPTRPEHRKVMTRTLEKVEDMDPVALDAGIPWDFESFPEYLDSVRRRGTFLNFAVYVGHTAVRLYVMGDDTLERAATGDEVESMARLVREAMAAGAAGFATSRAPTHLAADGRPIPSRVAEMSEVEALGAVVGQAGRGVVALVGAGGRDGWTEMYEVQSKLGAPLTVTAMLTDPAGIFHESVEAHRLGRAAGGDVRPQVSCRPLAFSMSMTTPFTLNLNPVFAALEGGSMPERRQAYADEAWRASARAEWEGSRMAPNWGSFEIMESAVHPEAVGRRVVDLAADAGTDPLACLLDLTLAEPDLRLRVRAVLANGDPEGIAELLSEPGCVLGLSDAGAHVGQLCDACLPTDLLGNWVRGRGILGLEEAIRKLTAEPAALFGFADRGELRVGAWGDVVVFDPATVDPGPVRRVRDFPADSERLTADAPTGVSHVVVNGTPVIVDGELVPQGSGERPGMVVSPTARS